MKHANVLDDAEEAGTELPELPSLPPMDEPDPVQYHRPSPTLYYAPMDVDRYEAPGALSTHAEKVEDDEVVKQLMEKWTMVKEAENDANDPEKEHHEEKKEQQTSP